MKLLAHRGLWENPIDRNNPEALRLALAKLFGVETDIREFGGQLVISHDPPITPVQLVADFFELYCCLNKSAPLALNIKAEGLQNSLMLLLEQHQIKDYFCFDMSVPETLAYRRAGLRYFTRESEYETQPALYNEAAGVWMDMFHTDWIVREHILRHLDAGKQVALVSPELHHRAHEEFWIRLRESGLAQNAALMLCTDFPEAAHKFFNE